jgi:D-sedoheptulose 7-phosphate isomerase
VDTSVITAWANDINYVPFLPAQVDAYAESCGVLWIISTSGNSKNIMLAIENANKLGVKVVALTG